jgi:hypothetical protein
MFQSSGFSFKVKEKETLFLEEIYKKLWSADRTNVFSH